MEHKTYKLLPIPSDLTVCSLKGAIENLPLSTEGFKEFREQRYILKHTVELEENASEILDILKKEENIVLTGELISCPKLIDEWYLERHSIVGNDKYIDVIYSPGA